jgi:L-asparaginase II
VAPPPVLCEVIRSGFVESRHRGSLVVLDQAGAVRFAAGEVDAPIFTRSSMKPLQALAMVRAGLDLPPDRLALACASHSGEEVHAALCRAVLAGAGLEPDALGCPQAAPRAAGGPADRVHHNCSGKHAAMLATCVRRGWPIETYLDPGHPLQQAIRATVEELAGEPTGAVGVDGCGAPQFAFSLSGLARAFHRIAAAPESTPEGRIAGAMRAHPELVGGSGRDVTDLMRAVPGLIAKDGAEGVYGAALPDGRAAALKIEDGGMRAIAPVLVSVLRDWGASGEALDRWEAPPVTGGGREVGRLRPLPLGEIAAVA